MTNEVSPTEGINSEVAEATYGEMEATMDSGEQAEGTPKKGPAKLLHQRNEARKEVEEWKSKYEELANQAIDRKFKERDRMEEKERFVSSYGNEALEKVESILENYPDLAYDDALKIADPEGFIEKKPKYKVSGNVPRAVTEEKPLHERKDEEVLEGAKEELAAMGFRVNR